MNNTTPYTLTDSVLTVFLPEGPKSVARSVPAASQVLLEVRSDNPNIERIRSLLDPAAQIAETLTDTDVKLVGGSVLFRGQRIANTHLEDRLLDLAANGMDITPWKRFVARIEANPSAKSRSEIHLFCEEGNLPITEDGCILAYKRVTEDYTDCRTRSFDNSVGNVLQMARQSVDDNRDNTCSRGFHFCSQDYLRVFLGGRGRIMVVKIAPEDVVSIPNDYNNTKGRTWRYEVVGEIDVTEERDAEAWGITNHLVVDWYEEGDELDWDDSELYSDWDDEDDDEFDGTEQVTVKVREDAFKSAPEPRKGRWASRFKGWLNS